MYKLTVSSLESLRSVVQSGGDVDDPRVRSLFTPCRLQLLQKEVRQQEVTYDTTTQSVGGLYNRWMSSWRYNENYT